MWMKMFLERFDLVYINETGVSNRVHGGQLTQRGRELFHKDSEKISQYIIPQLIKQQKSKRFLFSYALHNAVLNNIEVVNASLKASKQMNILSFWQRVKIKNATLYGKIRPFIRRVYYKLFKKVKTN
jgi:hypothetical protein